MKICRAVSEMFYANIRLFCFVLDNIWNLKEKQKRKVGKGTSGMTLLGWNLWAPTLPFNSHRYIIQRTLVKGLETYYLYIYIYIFL